MVKPRSTPALWLRRLDFLSPWAAWTVGLGGGALAGAALAGAAPGTVGILGFLALLGAAAGLAASGEPIEVAERTGPNVEPPLMDLVEIPGGLFLMGTPENQRGHQFDEEPVHTVQISPFSCMRFPVTRRLYKKVMGQDPSFPAGATDNRPVNRVTWFQALDFCNRLSKRDGFKPCYQIKDAQVEWHFAANGYRLLTEAEWEYACRAGTTTRWSFGDDEERLGDHAWFGANSNSQPQSVGGKLPNAWGLYDMHGNVWEWCWDIYGPYTAEFKIDPTGAKKGIDHILRGGTCVGSPGLLRSALRYRIQSESRSELIGFRCARSLHRQP